KSVPTNLLRGELSREGLGPRRERTELLVAHVAWAPAEAAVGVHRELLGATHLEDAADEARHLSGRYLFETLHADAAGAQLAAVAVLLPEVELRLLAPGELEHELVGAG